jgi:hypothetical protein
MSDIVADLRKAGNDDEACGGTLDQWPCRFNEKLIKAAAEIERLRADNARLRAALEAVAPAIRKAAMEKAAIEAVTYQSIEATVCQDAMADDGKPACFGNAKMCICDAENKIAAAISSAIRNLADKEGT